MSGALRTLSRAARALARRRGDGEPPWAASNAAWNQVAAAARRAALARERGWIHAEAWARRCLQQRLLELRRAVDQSLAGLASMPASPAIAEIVRDLAALAEEFPGARIDLARREAAVVTAPVTLEGVALGPFEIVLSWAGERLGYRVVALEPRPSSGGGVVHPHVSDQRLCEGAARAPLQAALAEGRVLDFFTIVDRTLAAYNPESAYARLDEWDGAACDDCGSTTDADELAPCEQCGADLCGDCRGGCDDCGRCCCSGCGATCPCGSWRCRACLAPCGQCHQQFCLECLDEQELCAECAAAREADDADDASSPDVSSPAAPLLPTASAAADAAGVGQAGLSA